MDRELHAKHKIIASHYTHVDQWQKLKEEMAELSEELDFAEAGDDETLTMTDNTWNEIADVINVLDEIIIQHEKEDEVERIMLAKTNRQLERIEKGEG